MRAFVIRPFGVKGGIDFDRVERDLIAPALAHLRIDGLTTGDVLEAGNIREDMFQMLLVSDLVVADISIDNANAYYELGIRHALREKRTFLLRALGQAGDVPFDLRTDRYLAYDPNDPAATLAQLQEALVQTLASDRQDSPVFRLLPELREQDRSRFLPVPLAYRDEVKHAARTGLLGKLTLLAEEARGCPWESEGLRIVAREQFRSRSLPGARATLEALLELDPLDREANVMLGTVHQRLGDFAASELALRRVINHPQASAAERAEAFSLLGRNLKARWRDAWTSLPIDKQRAQALWSPLLLQAYDAYVRAFWQDLNHFYSGLNALALLTITLKLADELPEVLADRFPDDAQAAQQKADLEQQKRRLAGAVDFAIHANRQYLEQAGRTDPWVNISQADFYLLTSSRPGQIAFAYENALAGLPPFYGDSVRAQIELYDVLGLFRESIDKVREILPPAPASPLTTSKTRTILFTGHRIDAPDRAMPRFPPSKEPEARAAIRAAIERELKRGGKVRGIAGGAAGGDILFHEVCLDLSVPSELLLALPPTSYVSESVAPAGPNWVSRFYEIYARFPSAPILSATKELPEWLARSEFAHRSLPYDIWQRSSRWLLYEGLGEGAEHTTVIALWNGEIGDAHGGTEYLVDLAKSHGVRVEIIDTKRLFGLGPSARTES